MLQFVALRLQKYQGQQLVLLKLTLTIAPYRVGLNPLTVERDKGMKSSRDCDGDGQGEHCSTESHLSIQK